MAGSFLIVANEESGHSALFVHVVSIIVLIVDRSGASVAAKTVLGDCDNISADIEDETKTDETEHRSRLRLIYGRLQVVPHTVVLFIVHQGRQIDSHSLLCFKDAIDRS